MKKLAYILIAILIVVFVLYRGILDEVPHNFLFVNETNDSIIVNITFNRKFNYDGTRIFHDNTHTARLIKKDEKGSELFPPGSKHILEPGTYIFSVKPQEKIILGHGYSEKDLRGILFLKVKTENDSYSYDLPEIKRKIFNGNKKYTFAYNKG